MASLSALTLAPHRVAAPSFCRLLALLATALALGAAEEPRWQPLIDGDTLAGWAEPTPNPCWHVEHGVLTGDSNPQHSGSILWTKSRYANFILETEVRWSEDADSGVMFRTPALQMQIGKSISLKHDMTGSFYINKGGYVEAGQAKEAGKFLRPGDWNTIRLEARDSTFTVWINGHQVAKYTDAKYPGPGPIGVQIHPRLQMKVEYRNLRIAELP